jgi:translation elongation factor EF-Tu-like GTPase
MKKVGLVEEELREMLTRYGFNGKEAPVVMGSSKLFLEEPDNTSEYGRPAIEKYVLFNLVRVLLTYSTG